MENENEGGWIKMFYRFLEWEWYGDTNMVRLFLHLLLKANYKPLRWQGLNVERGQFVTSLRSLCDQTGLHERSVRTCLSRLEKTGEILQKTTNKYRIITICNYERYQMIESDERQTTDKQPTSKRQTRDKQTTTSKEGKKGRKEEYSKLTDVSLPTSCDVGLRKKEPLSIVTKAKEVFESFYSEEYGESYYWEAKDAANMKKLLQKIVYSRENRESPLPVDEASVICAFKQFLESINKDWIRDNFSVSKINGFYNDIISEIKNRTKLTANGRYNQKGQQSETADSNRQRESILVELAEAEQRWIRDREKGAGAQEVIPAE